MKDKNTYLIIHLVILGLGLIILFCNVPFARYLTLEYLSDIGVGEKMEIEIFKNYSYMVLILGGVLFSKGIYGLTKYELISQNKE